MSAILFCTIILFGAIALIVAISVWQHSGEYVKFDKNRLKDCFSSLVILDDNGEPLVESFVSGDFKQVSLSALDKKTYMAFVCVEDKRFFSHGGIDTKRLVGALLANLKSGSFKEGASTISQQLIKNTHLSGGKTIKRKLNELMIVRELEENYSKEEILEMYLNTIYFGRRAYGIENAAEVYFGKSAPELTLSESAVLAGMIKAPNVYAPNKNIEKCKNRRNLVLDIMRKQGVISQDELSEAKNEPINVAQRRLSEKNYASCVLDEACKLLNITERQLLTSDYVIETYCNQTFQNKIKTIAEKDNAQNFDGSAADMTFLLCDTEGNAQGYYCKGNECKKRQAGSAFKPIAVYTPALCEGQIFPASPVLDEQTDFNGYKPSNAGKYYGWTTIQTAVEKSLNIPAVKTLNALTCKTAEKYLQKLGICGKQDLSLALGNINGGIDVVGLAKCYTALAKGGYANEIRFIKKIHNSNGVVYDETIRNSHFVYDSASSCLMTDMLVKTAKCGTAKKLGELNFEVAAKTGTVGNSVKNTDALVAGYTTENIFVCWYYGDLPVSMTGGGAPCALVANVLAEIYDDKHPSAFERPADLVKTLKIAKNELYNNQRIVQSCDGEEFMFDCRRCPKSIDEKRLTCEKMDGYVKIALTDSDCKNWILEVDKNGMRREVALIKGVYFDIISDDTKYRAKLMGDNDEVLYVTQTCNYEDFIECKSLSEFWKGN